MRVAVIDHGMGNLRSVAKALVTAGADVTVTADVPIIRRADALCVPGQGIFGRCMSNLQSLGLDDLVREWIEDDRRFLGICLGMQVLFEKSDEGIAPGAGGAGPTALGGAVGGGAEGLGILDGVVGRLPSTVRVPHIGWNTVADSYFYFDHSFAVHPADESIVTGWCDHGERFAARVETGPVLAVQFHPEKSGTAGIGVLSSWLQRS